MRKLFLLLVVLILLSGFLYAQEDVIPIKIVEFPLPASARTYQIGEYRSFVEMDRPFMGDGFNCRFAPYTSANIADYPIGIAGLKRRHCLERLRSENQFQENPKL